MSLPPDPPPAKSKHTAQQRQARLADRRMSIRLRMMISRTLDERGITAPADIGAALNMPPDEAVKLLTRHQWRDGDVALLEAAAARLGLPVAEAPGD
jgi:DNA-binding GntR family transcriptional regulator